MPMISPASAYATIARGEQAPASGRDEQRGRERAVAVLGAGADDAEEQQHAEMLLPTASALRLSAIVFGSPARIVMSTIASVEQHDRGGEARAPCGSCAA